MVNIAVCDDDIQFATDLENRILSYGKQKAVSLDTEVFSDGDSLLQAILNGGQYDLVYMDIEMGNRNGISTVREIKKISLRPWLFMLLFMKFILHRCLKRSLFVILVNHWRRNSLTDTLNRL